MYISDQCQEIELDNELWILPYENATDSAIAAVESDNKSIPVPGAQ